jgi:hypothetical protein
VRRRLEPQAIPMSTDVEQMSGHERDLVASAEEMLDYAMIAGAELKNPKFVSLLRLARRALLRQDKAPANPESGTPI